MFSFWPGASLVRRILEEEDGREKETEVELCSWKVEIRLTCQQLPEAQ